MVDKPIWTNNQIINQLDSGVHWTSSNLTFGFLTDASWFPYNEKNGFSQLNVAQKQAATLTIKLWDDLISADFSLSANGTTANVKFANTTTNIDYAQAYWPGNWSGAGSVWFNPYYGDSSGTNNLVHPTVGEWGFATYIHEVGHALGLNHPGNYDGGWPTYANDALYTHDSQQYTVMTYFEAFNTGADWVASDGHMYYAQTPMLDDIMVIQAAYGAETTTRTGNTTYGFNATADSWLFDFTQNQHPVLCIYDSSGIDTLDLSGWSYSCVINLAPGSFSNADMMTYNISIAYTAWIENAVGGSGGDTLTGNNIANILDGRAGADSLAGGGGNDVFVYKIGYGADVITDFSGDVIDLSSVAAVVDLAGVLALATQVGANTVINFGTGNTLTLQNVNRTSLTAQNFDFAGGPGDPPPPGPNLAPTAIGLSNAQVSENAVGATIGAVMVTDPNGDTAFSFAVSDARFAVVGAPGAYQLKLASGVALDFETEPSINLTIQAVDAGGLATSALPFVITVANVVAGVTITGTGNSNVINGTRTVTGQAFVTGENDTVYGLGGNDTISGLGGDDDLRGDAGKDTLNGNEGNDTLEGGAGTDLLNGGEGNDIFVVSGTNDTNDTRNGGEGVDQILVSGDGALTLYSFNATTASIEVWQGNGQAVLGTTAANVFNFSGLQSVTDLAYVDGGSGNDTITGTQFADDLRGGSGSDVLNGGAGDDQLSGGNNNDRLTGGTGRDTLVGGAAADTFVFVSFDDSGVGANADVISDFSASQLDKINLTAIDAVSGNGDDAFSYIGNAAFTGNAGQLRFADGVLMADRDGDSVSDFEIALTNVTSLAASSLLL